MDPLDHKIDRIKELLREVYAILGTFDKPNIRSATVSLQSDVLAEVQHYENLALLTGQQKPGPLVPVEPEIQRIPAESEVLVEPE